MKHTTIALLTLIVLANCTSAAPAPWGITINHDTKECAGFWGGDEYIAYGLPKGWTAYYPDPNTGIMTTNTGIMTTETGTCKFIKFTEGAEENCCKAMGYNYTGHEIGEFKPFKGFVGLFIIMGIAFAAIAAIVILVLIIRWIRKKKSGRTPKKRSRK